MSLLVNAIIIEILTNQLKAIGLQYSYTTPPLFTCNLAIIFCNKFPMLNAVSNFGTCTEIHLTKPYALLKYFFEGYMFSLHGFLMHAYTCLKKKLTLTKL